MGDLFRRFATTRQIEPIIGIKDKTLYRLRLSGVLEKGKHYRLKNPLNPKSHILYDVEAVIAELTREDLEERLIWLNLYFLPDIPEIIPKNITTKSITNSV